MRSPASDGSSPVRSSAWSSIAFATIRSPRRSRRPSSIRPVGNPSPRLNATRRRWRRPSTGWSFAATVTGWRGSTGSRPRWEVKLRREFAWRRITCGEACSASGCPPDGRAPFSNRGSRSTRTGGCATGTSADRPRSRRGHPARSQRIRLAQTRALPPRPDHCNRTPDRFPRVTCRNSYGKRKPCLPRPASERRAPAIPATSSQWQPVRRNENPQGGNGYCRTPAMR